MPVKLSKKTLPIVQSKVIEWLEKCVEFTDKISTKTNVNFNDAFELLTKAWHKLLLCYMIESNFDFNAIKDCNYNHHGDEQPTAKSSEENAPDSPMSSSSSTECALSFEQMPKERDAKHLRTLIYKGGALNLNAYEFDELREIILFKEGHTKSDFQKAYTNAQRNLKNMVEMNHGRQQYLKLSQYLPNIFNLRRDIIENLFCRHLKQYKSVSDLLYHKLNQLTSKEKI